MVMIECHYNGRLFNTYEFTKESQMRLWLQVAGNQEGFAYVIKGEFK